MKNRKLSKNNLRKYNWCCDIILYLSLKWCQLICSTPFFGTIISRWIVNIVNASHRKNIDFTIGLIHSIDKRSHSVHTSHKYTHFRSIFPLVIAIFPLFVQFQSKWFKNWFFYSASIIAVINVQYMQTWQSAHTQLFASKSNNRTSHTGEKKVKVIGSRRWYFRRSRRHS